MKIPVDHMEFPGYTTEAGDTMWVDVPRSVKEGLIHDLTTGSRQKEAEKDGGRSMNLRMLDQIVKWNFDGDDGKLLKLPREIKVEDFTDDPADQPDGKTAAEKRELARGQIIGQIPTEIIITIVKKIGGAKDVSEKTKDF